MSDIAPSKIGYIAYTGQITERSAAAIAEQYAGASSSGIDEVYLCLNSSGGSIPAGMYLYNFIKAMPMKTTIHAIGDVSSMAVIATLAADRRIASPHSVAMIHGSSCTRQNASANELQSAAESIGIDDERILNVLRTHTTIPEQVLDARIVRDLYFPASVAREYGIFTEVADFALPPGASIYHIPMGQACSQPATNQTHLLLINS